MGVSASGSVLAIASLVAFVIYFGCFIALHFLPTGYNPLYNTVSDYAIGRFGGLTQRAIIIYAAGMFLLLGSLVKEIGSPPISTSGLVWLTVLAFSKIGIALFKTDMSGQKKTVRGLVHFGIAVISVWSGASTLIAMTANFSSLSEFHVVYPFFRNLVNLLTPLEIAMVITLFLPGLRRIFGLFERAFLITINIWLLVVSGVVSFFAVGLLH